MVNTASKKRPRENSSSSEESENEYQVEAIVDKRFKAKKFNTFSNGNAIHMQIILEVLEYHF
jgi:hypothetical protein